MNVINSFIHSEIFFYILIGLFVLVLLIFGIVIYIECRKLKVEEAKLDIDRLAKEKHVKPSRKESTPKRKLEDKIELAVPIEDEEEEDFRELNQSEEEQEEALGNTTSLEIENLLARMQEDLEAKENETKIDFEKEEEEQAVISYHELISRAQDQSKMDIDDQTPISNRVLEQQIQKKQEKEKEEKKTGFHNSQFISPVYGIQKEKKTLPDLKAELKELRFDREEKEVSQNPAMTYSRMEEHHTVEDDHQIDENIEFLDSLKEFRKNLE